MLNRKGVEFARGCRGITLVEIVLTIVILGIIVPSLFLAITQGTQSGVNSEVQTAATLLAQEKMEEKIAAKREAGGYASAELAPGTVSDVPMPNFSRNTTICFWDPGTGVCAAADVGYKWLSVTVQYTQPLPNGAPSAALETLVTDY